MTLGRNSISGVEWRRVVGYPDYEVSSKGLVRRATPGRGTYVGRLLTPCPCPRGYLYVSLAGERRAVHALVCRAFHGPPPSAEHEVAHNDGVRGHNNETNLRWALHADNMADIKVHGTGNPPQGEKQGRSKLTTVDVLSIKARLAAGERPTAIARDLGVTHGTIGHIAAGRNWRHLGDAHV